jgi:hypothetical protein
MDHSSYKYNAMAFWLDHIDDDPPGATEEELSVMADELDATAQDVAGYWLERGEAPWLCCADDLPRLDMLTSACEMLLVYWKNGTAVDGGSEVADRIRAALEYGRTTDSSKE